MFDKTGKDAIRLHAANSVYRSSITTCKGITFEIVTYTELPMIVRIAYNSEAWKQVRAYFESDGTTEQRRLSGEISQRDDGAG